jgi:hypothetical protein
VRSNRLQEESECQQGGALYNDTFSSLVFKVEVIPYLSRAFVCIRTKGDNVYSNTQYIPVL